MTPLPSPDGNEYAELDAELAARPVRPELDALESEKARRAARGDADLIVNARVPAAAYEDVKRLVMEAGGNVATAARDTGEVPELGRQQAAVLEANGYNAIRAQIMANVNGLAELPGEAIDATEAFTRRALTNARIDPRPEARQAIDAMEAELNIYAVVHELRRELIALEKRAQARDRIIAR